MVTLKLLNYIFFSLIISAKCYFAVSLSKQLLNHRVRSAAVPWRPIHRRCARQHTLTACRRRCLSVAAGRPVGARRPVPAGGISTAPVSAAGHRSVGRAAAYDNRWACSADDATVIYRHDRRGGPRRQTGRDVPTSLAVRAAETNRERHPGPRELMSAVGQGGGLWSPARSGRQ